MLTRDSWVLKALCLASVIVGVLAAVTDPVSLGFTPEAGAVWLSRVKLLSTLLAAVTGYLMTSPLPGENDDKRVGGNNTGRMLLLPLLLTGSLLATSCAAFAPAPAGPSVPVITETEQAQVRAAATKALAGIEVAGVVVRDARDMVSQLHAQGVLSIEVRTQVNDAVSKANKVVQRVITEIAQATRLVTVEGLVRQGVSAILELAAVLEQQSDTRIVMAATFVRSAIRAVGAMVGIEVGQ